MKLISKLLALCAFIFLLCVIWHDGAYTGNFGSTALVFAIAACVCSIYSLLDSD